MALKMEFTQREGFLCPKQDSYLKITAFSGDKDSVTAELSYYHVVGADKFLCLADNVQFILDLLSTDNIIKQAYTAFKAKVGYELAEDC